MEERTKEKNMKNIAHFAAALGLAALTIATGCVSSDSGEVFSRSETKTASQILYGTVTEVRQGKVEGTKSGVGAIAGGVLGGATGHTIGGGSGNVVATVGGALAGALIGNAVEKGVTGSKAVQVTVKLDTGKEIQVVQGTDIPFAVGQRVRVIYSPGGHSRVQPL
jgi:outer membrane lipoprotein SlyB